MKTKIWILGCVGVVLMLMACSPTGSTGQNPIIDNHPCTAPDSGSRTGYHAPGTDVWLPDCELTLERAYWRVFVNLETEKAYIIPRPDGALELSDICQELSHPNHELVTSKSLCEFASNSTQVQTINNLEPSEALTITQILHEKLVFVYDEQTTSILPFPIPADILDACDLRSFEDEAELETLCEAEADRVSSGQEIGIIYSGEGAKQLVRRLNELYGIENE